VNTTHASADGLGVNGDTVPAIGGPTSSSWREDALARIAELEMLTVMARARTTVAEGVADEMAATIRRHLDTAKRTAEQPAGRRAGIAGADVTRVLTNIHAAEADLLRLAPTEYVLGQLPTLHAYVREHLPARDPRRARLEALVRSGDRGKLAESQRGMIVAAAREANAEARREVTRVRSFRNVLLVSAAILTLAAIALAVVGIVEPNAVPLCFHPDAKVVCPTEEVAVPRDIGDIDGPIAATTSPTSSFVAIATSATAANASSRSSSISSIAHSSSGAASATGWNSSIVSHCTGG